MPSLAKLLIVLGLGLAALGVLLWLVPRVPGLDRLGRLPGDIRIERENVRFYFPWVSCLLISALVTLVAKLITYWRK